MLVRKQLKKNINFLYVSAISVPGEIVGDIISGFRSGLGSAGPFCWSKFQYKKFWHINLKSLKVFHAYIEQTSFGIFKHIPKAF